MRDGHRDIYMIRHFLAAAAIGAALIFASGASAENLRIPVSGAPAAMIVSPLEWASLVTDSNGILLYPASQNASLTVTIAAERGSLDALAEKLLKASKPPKSAGAIAISGFHGNVYESAGSSTKSRLILVRLDNAHVATALLITLVGMDTKSYAAARGALDSLKLTAK